MGTHRAPIALFLLAVLASPVLGKDAPLPGSIPVSGKHSADELRAMAKIPMDRADSIALEAVEGAPADKTIHEHELEVEGGVLVYSIEVGVKGKKGVDEILVDAGDGKILKREHEKH